jgi:glycosyltransferase involved in cell wall biosynthesis
LTNIKKVVLVAANLPNPFYSGGTLTPYAIILAFINRGYRVSVLSWKSFDSGLDDKAKSLLKGLGVEFIFLKPLKFGKIDKYLSVLDCNFNKLFPHVSAKKEIESILSQIKPDLLVTYHWEGLAATHGIEFLPKLGLVGDPINLPYVYRRRLQNILLRQRIKYQIKFMKQLLNDCSSCGAFAAHHADMFKEWGVSSCRYFRTPMPDPFNNGTKSRVFKDKPKILLLGHLKGIATLSGIKLFTNEIMPYLEKELGNDFEVHVIGNFFDSLPLRLKSRLSRLTGTSIIIRGQVNPIDDEFLTSNLLLVPTPIELGIRVRILTAFSFGTPVVAHSANKKGIPELAHEDNVLMSDSGIGLAQEVVRLLRSKELQVDLSKKARLTYEKYFSLNTAGNDIVNAAQALLN